MMILRRNVRKKITENEIRIKKNYARKKRRKKSISTVVKKAKRPVPV